MAKTLSGDEGKLIQLKRTELPYDNQLVTNEQLNFGEPLYNDNDKTLLIGDNISTSNDNLKVFKALDRNKANSQVYLANSGSSTLDNNSQIGNLFTETNTPVFIKDKDWGSFVLSNSDTTYNFTIDAENVIVEGTQQSTSFESLPCLVKLPVNGMQNAYVPTVSLYLSRENTTSVSNIKAQNKAFSCIGRCDSAENYLYIVYYKQPSTSFSISVVGG